MMIGLFKALYVIANHETSSLNCVSLPRRSKQGAGEKLALAAHFVFPLPQKQRRSNQSITCSLWQVNELNCVNVNCTTAVLSHSRCKPLLGSISLAVVVKPYFIASCLLDFDITYIEACKIKLRIHDLDMACKVYVKLLLHNTSREEVGRNDRDLPQSLFPFILLFSTLRFDL